jgi:hypothetical protein
MPSPLAGSGRTYAILWPSADQRSPPARFTSIRGGPPSGAGISQIPRSDVGADGAPAYTAIVLPSGEISGPPIEAWLCTSSPLADVRFTPGPPPTNLTHRSVRRLSEAK